MEVWKLGDRKVIEWLQCLFDKMRQGEQMPDEWRLSWLVPLYKGKGEVQECKNYRRIKLLSHTMKVWERVVEGRLRRSLRVAVDSLLHAWKVHNRANFHVEASDVEDEEREEADADGIYGLGKSI